MITQHSVDVQGLAELVSPLIGFGLLKSWPHLSLSAAFGNVGQAPGLGSMVELALVLGALVS